MGRRDEIEKTINRLQIELTRLDRYPAEDPYVDGDVIRFEKPLKTGGYEGRYRRYTFVALKAAGRWYRTGANMNGGRASMTWDELVEWLGEGGSDLELLVPVGGQDNAQPATGDPFGQCPTCRSWAPPANGCTDPWHETIRIRRQPASWPEPRQRLEFHPSTDEPATDSPVNPSQPLIPTGWGGLTPATPGTVEELGERICRDLELATGGVGPLIDNSARWDALQRVLSAMLKAADDETVAGDAMLMAISRFNNRHRS